MNDIEKEVERLQAVIKAEYERNQTLEGTVLTLRKAASDEAYFRAEAELKLRRIEQAVRKHVGKCLDPDAMWLENALGDPVPLVDPDEGDAY